jgi:hypothetical protein
VNAANFLNVQDANKVSELNLLSVKHVILIVVIVVLQNCALIVLVDINYNLVFVVHRAVYSV